MKDLKQQARKEQGRTQSVKRIAKGFQFVVGHSVLGPVSALVIVTLIFAVGTGGSFLSPASVQNLLSLSSLMVMTVFGSSLVILMGAIDLSVEGVVALTAVIGGLLIDSERSVVDLGLLAIPVIVLLGAAAGFLNGIINTRLKIPSLITTLGMWFAALGIAVVFSGGATNSIKDTRFQMLANGHALWIPNITLIAVGIFLVLLIVERRTAFGKHIFAIGGNEELARQAGVKVERVKVAVFSIAGGLNGLTGLFLVSRLLSSNPTVSKGVLFPAITAVVVGGTALSGGIGGVINAFIGALVVTVLRSGMVQMHISPYIQGAVTGVVLIAAVTVTMDRKKVSIIK
ncbi:MAG: ABC transporter permease [Spirochaetales bacterium]|nr:ABC transporter permease [Spirochaetales bacterium]